MVIYKLISLMVNDLVIIISAQTIFLWFAGTKPFRAKCNTRPPAFYVV